MIERVTSAPAKAVLCGEYAVMDGAAAICMAINRRARATVCDIDGAESRVTAPGFSDVIGRFEQSKTSLQWLEGQAEFSLVDAVWQATGYSVHPAVAIVLDSGDFADSETGQKFGVGASAALTVALCAALRKPCDVAATAQRAHRILQGGAGSGVDVACSASGGLIEYRMHDAVTRTLTWPAGLKFSLIWTGVTASTTDKLAQLGSKASMPSRARLTVAADAMAMAWRSGDARRVMSAYDDYLGRLRDFDSDHALGIFAAGHDVLCDAARAQGLVYKPCGAGGGDIGIVFGTDEVRLEGFVASLPPGFLVLAGALESDGARVEGPIPE